MSNYKYYTQYDAHSYTKGRQGNQIKDIVIHHWGNDGQKFFNVVNFFTRPTTQTSAHYVVEDGHVACLVDCKDTAWHAGNWNENLVSIGIECRPECTNGDIETIAELVAELWKAYPSISHNLKMHKQFFNTACPGRYQHKLKVIEEIAEQYYNQTRHKIKQQEEKVVNKYSKDQMVVIASHATHTLSGIPISNNLKGKNTKIIGVIAYKQSRSNYQYLLEGINDYILEQDLALDASAPMLPANNCSNNECVLLLSENNKILKKLDTIFK